MRTTIAAVVDPATLAGQLSAALGLPVALSVRQPDSSGQNGVIVLIDPSTGDEIPNQDSTKIAAVLAAHTPPPPPVTPAGALAAALGSVNTVPDVIAALKSYAGALTAQEAKGRQRVNPAVRG